VVPEHGVDGTLLLADPPEALSLRDLLDHHPSVGEITH
jgi:hypothetical protein